MVEQSSFWRNKKRSRAKRLCAMVVATYNTAASYLTGAFGTGAARQLAVIVFLSGVRIST